MSLATSAISQTIPKEIKHQKKQIFHVLFWDNHQGDHHLILLAQNAQDALQKCERHLAHKKADSDTIQIFSEKDYRRKFPIERKIYYVFYRNGRAKYCPILAINSVQAEQMCRERFGIKPEEIMDKETFKATGKDFLKTMAN
ncbi:MAG: hypothetical protein GF365_02030 [Candidatus Buchananbacteria bacterium]|nr:hypothetical protein [Candidatus Buchananbacteria bacterium]